MMRRISILTLNTIALMLLIYIQAEFPNLNRKYGIPARYFDAVLLYCSSLLVLAIVKSLVLGVYARKNRIDPERTNDNFTLGVRRISSVVGALILLISLLGAFNVDVKSLFTALSIFAAGLAIVARDYVTSIINGMILMFTDTINIHDEVKIDDAEGKVVNINFINVELLGDNGDIIIVPNNSVMSHSIVNYTRCVTPTIYMETDIHTDSFSSVADIRKTITAKLTEENIEYDNEKLIVEVSNLQRDILTLNISASLHNRTVESERRIKRIILGAMADYISREK